ncbi:MAG TPA: flagellin [Candidatus Scybalomonas excrementigallinarum]|nr:flagellin [Candidatus Scybalomonas excrementigallinarum]
MRIQHNIAALNANRQLSGNNSAISKSLEKLSSGYRINRAGDDAAGLSISEKMRSQITGLDTAQKNAEDGVSLIQTAEGALTEVHSMLNRMVELATQSANGIYEAEDRKKIKSEVDALNAEISRIAKNTTFNGQSLLTSGSQTFQIGPATGDVITVSLVSMDASSLGIGTIDVTTVTGSTSAIASINAAIDQVSTFRSNLGAVQNRLEHTINNLSVNSENLTAAESRIRDVDMAKEMMNYTKNNILTQAAQSMLAQANQLPQGVLQLLQ